MIELNDVHKSFGENEVLKGITASVEKGEVVCIVGPSGSFCAVSMGSKATTAARSASRA